MNAMLRSAHLERKAQPKMETAGAASPAKAMVLPEVTLKAGAVVEREPRAQDKKISENDRILQSRFVWTPQTAPLLSFYREHADILLPQGW